MKVLNNPYIKSTTLGHCHSFYVEKNGDLYGCGLNTNGQLGLGDNETRNKFVKISTKVRKVCTTYKFTIIQKENRNVYFTGQGLGKMKKSFSLLDIKNVSTFCCGFDHAVFLCESGEIFVMGSNEYDELGITHKYVKTPQLLTVDKNAYAVCCGYENTIIISKNGNKTTLRCFGKTINSKSLETLPEEVQIKSVHCGAYHSFILTEKGDVYGCGVNSLGQLGNGTFANSNQFFKIDISNIIYLTTGYSHSIMVNDKNEIFVCGHQNRLGFSTDKPIAVLQKLNFTGLSLFNNHEINDIWTPEYHHKFPEIFKTCIFTFLGCIRLVFMHTKNNKFPIKIPKPLLFIMIKFSYEMEKNFKVQPKNLSCVFSSTINHCSFICK